ncbi:hypothetical protein BZA05DRAFT_181146 [Tricharina praecox]|uniref:uncharacterized protein n=1 Tax=Tricharina praecox TaxID=43433 RepID=UPI002220B0EB|nr:uncharacterized protein BZA05DRAFT_181146 [Tricharina praecox]KAI5843761.1 hypothetical protein BZA05DRAFT_181146 [Tricharina praecox]
MAKLKQPSTAAAAAAAAAAKKSSASSTKKTIGKGRKSVSSATVTSMRPQKRPSFLLPAPPNHPRTPKPSYPFITTTVQNYHHPKDAGAGSDPSPAREIKQEDAAGHGAEESTVNFSVVIDVSADKASSISSTSGYARGPGGKHSPPASSTRISKPHSPASWHPSTIYTPPPTPRRLAANALSREVLAAGRTERLHIARGRDQLVERLAVDAVNTSATIHDSARRSRFDTNIEHVIARFATEAAQEVDRLATRYQQLAAAVFLQAMQGRDEALGAAGAGAAGAGGLVGLPLPLSNRARKEEEKEVRDGWLDTVLG